MPTQPFDSFQCQQSLHVDDSSYLIWSLEALATRLGPLDALPFCQRILLENLLRHEDDRHVIPSDIEALACDGDKARDISIYPARVLMQDFTGVPALVDLAALRDAVADAGGTGSAL